MDISCRLAIFLYSSFLTEPLSIQQRPLYEQGLVVDQLVGKDKAIEIRPNSKPAVEVSGNPEDLPEPYRTVKWVADKEAIAQAHLQGVDISDYATVTYGKQVRFKNAPRTRKRED